MMIFLKFKISLRIDFNSFIFKFNNEMLKIQIKTIE